MLLSFRITKDQEKALLSIYPDIRGFAEKTISAAADKIIIERDLFNIDEELKEYHNRRSLNDHNFRKRKMTQATKDKIRKSLKKYYAQFAGQEFHLWPETKRLIGIGNKGKIISKETRKKISLANKGKKRTEEQRERISQGHKGIKRSEETKRKISLVHKGMKYKKHIN